MKKDNKPTKQRKTFRFNEDELAHINGMSNPSEYVRGLVAKDMKKGGKK